MAATVRVYLLSTQPGKLASKVKGMIESSKIKEYTTGLSEVDGERD